MLLKRIIISSIFFLPLLLIAKVSSAQIKKDTLFFYNNEILIGELKQMNRGLINFDSDAIGITNVKVYRLTAIRTNINTLRIETTRKVWVYGKLVPTGSKDSIFVVNGVDSVKLAIDEISSIFPFGNRFIDQLQGKISAGLSFSRLSSIGQFNLNAQVTQQTRSFKTELIVSELGSIDSSRFSRDQESLQAGTYHFVKNSTWLQAGILSYQRNLELSLAHRYQAVLGIGNKFISDQHTELLILSGLSGNQEKSIEGVSSAGLLMEIPLLVKLDFFKFKAPNIQVSMSNAGYISLSEAGRYRYDGNISFSWELVHDFYFTTNLFGNYDSKPPDSGSGKTDYGLVTGISYKF